MIPEPSIPQERALSFASQACQFDRKGPSGFEHFVATDVTDGRGTALTIHCLLWRNRHGDLVGILYYYPQDSYERDGRQLEKAGNVNVFIRPDSQRQGIGTRLVEEALDRWPIDFAQQRYTPAGHALATKLTARQVT